MVLAQRRIGLEEFLKLPEEKPALEYIDGKVSQKLSPKARHSAIQVEIVERINSYARPRRLARAFSELRFTFAGSSTVPDVGVMRLDRVPYGVDGVLVDDVLQAPEVAIEIISPEQSANALFRKCLWYVENGVQVALLIDPDDESILAFRPRTPPAVLRDTDNLNLDEVMPGFELIATDLFMSLRRP
jgi:Uma2 family endonuclease